MLQSAESHSAYEIYRCKNCPGVRIQRQFATVGNDRTYCEGTWKLIKSNDPRRLEKFFSLVRHSISNREIASSTIACRRLQAVRKSRAKLNRNFEQTTEKGTIQSIQNTALPVLERNAFVRACGWQSPSPRVLQRIGGQTNLSRLRLDRFGAIVCLTDIS